MGKLRREGNGGYSEKYLGFNIPPNTLMVSFNDQIEILSAPSKQKEIGFSGGEDKNHVFHKFVISFPLTEKFAEEFNRQMKKT